MDIHHAMAFVDYMVGGRVVGATQAQEIITLHSPELRAFIVGILGNKTPAGGYYGLFAQNKLPYQKEQAEALAKLLREVADALNDAPSL